MQDLWRTSPGFLVAAVATLAFAALFGLLVALMAAGVDLPGAFGEMGHFQEPHHRVHDLVFGLLFIPPVVGVAAQLRRPAANLADMIVALVPATSLLLIVLLTAILYGDARTFQPPWVIVGATTLVAVGLHPAGGELGRSFRRRPADPVLVALLAVAAVPLLLLATRMVALQGTVADDHAAAGHYGFVAGFALTVIGVGLLAAMRPDGWRLAAWVAGLLPPLLGAASLAYPLASSSLSAPWAVGAITWGAAYIAVAERRRADGT